MCGRYAASANPDDLVEELEIESDETGGAVQPDYNVAPTHQVPVVLERAPRADREAAPVRQLRMLTWGLVPSWAKDPKVGSRMINARVESLFDKPGFKRAAAARRCLVPADGWYEWQVSPTAHDAKGKPRKQPFFTHLADGGRLAFGGLYEFWRDPAKPDDADDAWLTTFTIITGPAEPGLDRLHDRMPFVVPRERWGAWLDPALTDPDEVRGLLEPLPPGRFVAYPVSRRVGDVRNEGPTLLEPARAEELVGVVDPMTGEILGGS
ncbi:SOS response-associated peptidase [Angustibacter sp. McL0619]|uniref:SOS response-associated peptidase n=1 Tax=Angustibacter sp. McL0619 TaxID=3415676 RepID=UPI003CFB92C0